MPKACLYLFLWVGLVACESHHAQLHRPVDPDPEFEESYARIQALETQFLEQMQVRMVGQEREGLSRLVGRFTYSFQPTGRAPTELKLAESWEYYQAQQELLERYSSLGRFPEHGGLSPENQLRLQQTHGKAKLVYDFLTEFTNPSFRWLDAGMVMYNSAELTLQPADHLPGLQYLGLDRALNHTFTHAAYLGDRTGETEFLKIGDPSRFCFITAKTDAVGAVTLGGQVLVESVKRRGVAVSSLPRMGGAAEVLQVDLSTDTGVATLFCVRIDKTYRPFTVLEFERIVGSQVSFPDMGREVLRYQGNLKDEMELVIFSPSR